MQQVNLFQTVEKKKMMMLSGMHVLALLIFAFSVMAAIQVFQMQKTRPIQANLNMQEQEQDRIQQQIAQLEQQISQLKPDKTLIDEIRQLRNKVSRGQEILGVLTDGALSNKQGFSPYLEAVANKHIQGTWLTGIDIESGGSFFSLSGKTITPDLVPEYMKNLSAESIFNDFSFNVLELQRSEEEPDVVHFHLATGGNG